MVRLFGVSLTITACLLLSLLIWCAASQPKPVHLHIMGWHIGNGMIIAATFTLLAGVIVSFFGLVLARIARAQRAEEVTN